MASRTFRGESPTAWGEALLAVLDYARNSEDEFEFSPTTVVALQRDGMRVSGTTLDEIDGVSRLLGTLPGIAEEL